MKQEIETNDILDLGRVSTDTKGGGKVFEDSENSRSLTPGLTDD